MEKKPIIFFSHIHEDKVIAKNLAEFIQDILLNGVDIFVSSDGSSIRGGDEWMERIKDALRLSKLMLVLFSQESLERRWIYFESGGAFFLDARVIPLCLPGCTLSDLPDPIRSLQGYEITNPEHFGELIKVVSDYAKLKMPIFNVDDAINTVIGIKPKEIITSRDKVKAYIDRTKSIIDALNRIDLHNGMVRQAASLSSYAISDNEIIEGDSTGEYRNLLLEERLIFNDLINKDIIVRIIICPGLQVNRVYQEKINPEFIKNNILTRYDQLISTIERNLDKPNFQIVQSLNLHRNNILIIDDRKLFIGTKSVRDKGFSTTELIRDPLLVSKEISEFDDYFRDFTANILNIDNPTTEDYESRRLKLKVIEGLQSSKDKIEQTLS